MKRLHDELAEVTKLGLDTSPIRKVSPATAELKKDPAQVWGRFVLLEGEPAIQAAWRRPEPVEGHWGGSSLYGVFNVGAAAGAVMVRLPDGEYTDVLTGAPVTVRGGKLPLPASAVILRYEGKIDLRPIYSELLDYHVEAA